MTTTRKIFAATLVLLALASGMVYVYVSLQDMRSQPAVATVWPAPKPLPEFSLMDQSGGVFSNDSLQGRWSLVFFGFTHCPDICPATLQQLAIARKRLLETGKVAPEVVFVSLDPERDSAGVLAAYVSHFGGEIRGVTGNIDELSKLTTTAGIFFEKSPLPDGSYSIDHSAAVLVIDDNGAIYASFSAPHDVDGFVHDVPVLMGSN